MHRNVSGIWAATAEMNYPPPKGDYRRQTVAGDFKSIFEDACEKEREPSNDDPQEQCLTEN